MKATLTGKRFTAIAAGYAAFLLIVMIIAPFIGSERISLDSVLGALSTGGIPHDNADAHIFFYQRLPRILLAFLAGGTLALCGVAFQALLRNPLATPYTLGIASGGALGASVSFMIPGLLQSWGPFSSVQLLALAGGLSVVTLVYFLSRRQIYLPLISLLLAGVTISLICGSMILMVRYLVSPHILVSMDRWLMGGLDIIGYRDLITIAPFLVVTVPLLMFQADRFNQISFGEEMAAGRGVHVLNLQRLTLFGGAVATASVVSLVGPIGFIGLIIPHAVRKISGSDYRLLMPCSFLAGGAFLILCDMLARTVMAPAELPVGIITSLGGGPFFLWLLLRGKPVMR
jgi:iron complex transport system permease protein